MIRPHVDPQLVIWIGEALYWASTGICAIASPLQHLHYGNHFWAARRTWKNIEFADDVTPYRQCENRKDIANSTQEERDRLDRWCTDHNDNL